MPLPLVAPAARTAPAPQANAAAAAGPGRLLFVSYSHRDMRAYADAFHRYLRLMLRNTPELGFGEDDVFFDRGRLKAGDDWDDSIRRALDSAAALVLLVSDNSLSSRYCVESELGAAVARGIPVLPVVLCECPWEGQPLPGDAAGRRLGALQALPKNDAFQLVPVRNWRDRNAAWDAVVEQMAAALRGGPEAAAEPARPAPGDPPGVPTLLPYFCNQVAAERAFNQGLREWERESSALLVLVKGVLDDRPPQFWARLRHKNLVDMAAARRGHQVLAQRPLKWPPGWDGVRLVKSLGMDVLGALSDALSGNQFDIDGPQRLGARLQELGGVLPLLATLPQEPPRVLGAALRELLALLEGVPEAAPLERLVLSFIVEDEALIAEAELARRLKLGSWRRTRIVELERISTLKPRDVWDWHRNYELSRYCGLHEDELVERVFGQDTEPLRFAQFETRLKPLLGLKGAP